MNNVFDSLSVPDIHDIPSFETAQAAIDTGLTVGSPVFWVDDYGARVVKQGYFAGYNFDHPFGQPVVHQHHEQPEYHHGSYTSHLIAAVPAKPAKPQSKKKDKLVMDALAAARKRGYCNETKNIIRDIGLQIPTTKQTMTIEVEVTGIGVDVEALIDEGLKVNVSCDHSDVTVRTVSFS